MSYKLNILKPIKLKANMIAVEKNQKLIKQILDLPKIGLLKKDKLN
jgi:hypothetical protein